jgi:hypothetical protein
MMLLLAGFEIFFFFISQYNQASERESTTILTENAYGSEWGNGSHSHKNNKLENSFSLYLDEGEKKGDTSATIFTAVICSCQ